MESESVSAGADVVDSEGERLGCVIAATDEYIVAEQGFFFPTDFYIPRAMIDNIEEMVVRLTISKVDVLAKGWGVSRDTGSVDENPRSCPLSEFPLQAANRVSVHPNAPERTPLRGCDRQRGQRRCALHVMKEDHLCLGFPSPDFVRGIPISKCRW